LVRPRDERQGAVITSLFEEMGVAFERTGNGQGAAIPTPKRGISVEALEGIMGLLKDEISDEQFEEMIREAHR